MKPDPIVEEVHAIRDATASRFGNDLRAICDDARKRQSAATAQTTRRLPPRPAPIRPAKAR
jgi:hypothetical protein